MLSKSPTRSHLAIAPTYTPPMEKMRLLRKSELSLFLKSKILIFVPKDFFSSHRL
jgi:hypothetical protein